MNSRVAFASFVACSLFVGAVSGCRNYASTPTPSPTPIASISPAPDTLYVQDTTSKSVRVYKNASGLNGGAVPAISPLPTSDGSQPDVVYDPITDTLWFPQAQTLASPPPTTQIEIWNAASTDGGKNPNVLVPLAHMEGTAVYDHNHNYLYVALTTSNAIQVYFNATSMTSGSTPGAQVTLSFTDGTTNNPHPQELFYDSVNDRLFVADTSAVVAEFDAFGAGAGATHTATANRQICGLFSPDGMAYNTNDTLFVGEENKHQIDVIHSASTLNACDNHAQVITGFVNGPTGLAYDSARDILFVFDPNNPSGSIQVVPNATAASGLVSSVPNHRIIFDAIQGSLSGFGITVDTTH